MCLVFNAVDQFTTLIAACASTCESDASMLESIQTLIAAGANVNASDRYVFTGGTAFSSWQETSKTSA